MISRTIATCVIWIFSMYGLTSIVNRMSMTAVNVFPPESEMAALYPMGETVFMPDLQAFMMGLLMLAVVFGATISTMAVWRNAPANSAAKQEARAEAEKAKRREYYTPNDSQHQARLMRLVETLNDDDIAYLEARLPEARSLADDGELYMPRQ